MQLFNFSIFLILGQMHSNPPPYKQLSYFTIPINPSHHITFPKSDFYLFLHFKTHAHLCSLQSQFFSSKLHLYTIKGHTFYHSTIQKLHKNSQIFLLMAPKLKLRKESKGKYKVTTLNPPRSSLMDSKLNRLFPSQQQQKRYIEYFLQTYIW